MWTGTRFVLHKDLHAIEMHDGHEIRTTIPYGQVVEIIAGPREDYPQLVELRWLGREFVSFAVEVQACGEEVRERGA